MFKTILFKILIFATSRYAINYKSRFEIFSKFYRFCEHR